MNVGSFSKQQNKTSDAERFKRHLTTRVFQINVNTMKSIFEQRSELKVPQRVIVQILSSNCNVSRLGL